MSELKPCPFCGQPAVCEKMMIHYRVRCENDCSGYQHKRDAIMKWNTRANCDKCDRIEKWIDHVGCTPNKLQQYNKLLKFVKQLAHESVYEKYENLNEMNWAAFDLLEKIGESND